MIAAVRSGDPDTTRAGFETLVAVYWKPVYKYLRVKWNASSDDAQDTTQDFFARALEKRFFDAYDPGKGRFRTFLRVCLDRFVANERKAAGRLKRGGAHVLVPLDFATAEGELRQHEVAGPVDLDEYFHREWIRSLLALAVDDLRDELTRDGKLLQFRVFERYDLEDPPSRSGTTYASLAREMGIAPTDVTNYLFAVRRAFRRLLLERLKRICGDGDEFEAEARQLLRGGLR
jgi:DNA-directed RNA polymerase specialized sigma24 family protein